MADYYTNASFIIPCTEVQAEEALEALKHIRGELSQFAKEVIEKPSDQLSTAKEKIILSCFQEHPDQDPEYDLEDLEWNFNAEKGGTGIWIYENESINTEHAAIFTQAVLNAFDLPHLVGIEAAHTCSKPRLDGFGGHACVVTKDDIRWSDFQEFLTAEHEAHQNNEAYFYCTITEINGENEYRKDFLLRCSNSSSAEERLDEIFVSFRGPGEKEGDNFVWYPDGLAAKD